MGAQSSEHSAALSQLAHMSRGTGSPVELDPLVEVEPLPASVLLPCPELDVLDISVVLPLEPSLDPVLAPAVAMVGSLPVEPISSAGTHWPAIEGFPSSPYLRPVGQLASGMLQAPDGSHRLPSASVHSESSVHTK